MAYAGHRPERRLGAAAAATALTAVALSMAALSILPGSAAAQKGQVPA